ncbi:hypothetical protein DM02DRAFT_635714 [Periconia macrospinosa]|uniref:Uncharacterized protein n=1 Tax=Periconia macrospinosa TaxID=97972 RepID=A0A2V1D1W8_9PLEO|nr:hypothetical protein DM02DRAFT_635714 [Periconia macrospinosa]
MPAEFVHPLPLKPAMSVAARQARARDILESLFKSIQVHAVLAVSGGSQHIEPACFLVSDIHHPPVGLFAPLGLLDGASNSSGISYALAPKEQSHLFTFLFLQLHCPALGQLRYANDTGKTIEELSHSAHETPLFTLFYFRLLDALVNVRFSSKCNLTTASRYSVIWWGANCHIGADEQVSLDQYSSRVERLA